MSPCPPITTEMDTPTSLSTARRPINSSFANPMARLLPTIFGFPGAVPVPADYDGDGKTDLAYYRADTKSFYIKQSTTGNISTVTYPDLIGKPFAAYFLNIGRDVPATYDPATGKVLFYD